MKNISMKKIKKRIQLLAFLALAALLIAACAAPEDQTVSEPTGAPEASVETSGASAQADRVKFSAFTARDLDGEEITEAVFSDAKLTMLNVWGTFCGPCLNEMPDLGQLAQEYADAGVQIIGLVGDVTESEEDAEAVRELVEQTKADYRHLLPSEDLQTKVLSGLMYYPTTIFIDQEGYVVDNYVIGSHSKGEWKNIIDRMMLLAQLAQQAAPDSGEAAG